MGPGFFLEHGHPEVGTYDLKPIVFWPDEWDNTLHGMKAINNYVQVYLPDKQNEGIWRSGRIFEYCSDEDKYKVLLDTEEGSAVEVIPDNIQTITNRNNDDDNNNNDDDDDNDNNDNSDNDNHIEKIYPKKVTEESSLSFLGINPNNNEISSSFSLGVKAVTDFFHPEILDAISRTQITETVEPISNLENKKNNMKNTEEDAIIWESKDIIKISINKCKVSWAADNTSNRYNIINKKNTTSISSSSSIINIKNKVPLLFSLRDVGVFCRIWWSRYQRFFYGRIISYDSSSKEHRVTYEDGDTRTYDMSTKTYELIFLPTTFSLLGARDESDCARRVAVWHIEKSMQGTIT